MYTKNDLLHDIEKSGLRPDDTVLIHSSMKAIGEVDGGADTVLDAFSEYMSDGLLIFPAHTWKTITFENNLYDYRTEPSCVGILSNMFMKRPGVIRSLHPTHSVATLGHDAEDYVSGEENRSTPCSYEGCWGKLYDRDAKILFLGCGVACNTYLHGVEERCDIPDRLTPYEKPYRIVLRDGSIITRLHRRHHSEFAKDGDVSVHYSKIMPSFIENGCAHECRIGDADCTLADCVGMYEITSEQLGKNPLMFNDFS
ncbi:MAG: AAC(3) family N-acetyltransferase [Eubacteriales bacterium]